jgi:hypothetical protein
VVVLVEQLRLNEKTPTSARQGYRNGGELKQEEGFRSIRLGMERKNCKVRP